MPKPKNRGNGQGSVYRRGDKWMAEVVLGYRTDENGKKRAVRAYSGGHTTKKAALAMIPVLFEGNHKRSSERRVTIDSLWQFYSSGAMLKISKNKQTHYRTARKKLEDIAYVDIRALTIDDLQDQIDAKAPTYYPAKDMKTLLSHLYTRACAEQVVLSNLADFIVLPSLNEKPTQPFSCDEVITLWNGWNIGDTVCGLCLLMIYTGMMPGELCQLTTDMISWDDQTIIGCGIKTKLRQAAPIILPDIILPVLKKLCTCGVDKKVLPYPRDVFYDKFKEMIQRYDLNSELRPYSCRHTMATTLALADTPLFTIKDIMRHSKITTTQRYVHIKPAPLVQAVNEAYTAGN